MLVFFFNFSLKTFNFKGDNVLKKIKIIFNGDIFLVFRRSYSENDSIYMYFPSKPSGMVLSILQK